MALLRTRLLIGFGVSPFGRNLFMAGRLKAVLSETRNPIEEITLAVLSNSIVVIARCYNPNFKR